MASLNDEIDLKDHLLELIEAQDASTLSEFMSHEFPQLPLNVRDECASLNALSSSFSLPAQLLLRAVKVEDPGIFKILWDSFYAPHFADEPGPPSNSFERLCGDERVQIPWECLHQSAVKGSIPLASVFRECESLALSRAPPFSIHPAGRYGSLIISALLQKRFEYVDYMLAQGVDINHEWPRVRVLRTALCFEQDDAEIEFMLSWLLKRGVRVQGTGALRLMVQFRLIEAARILLDSGVDVEDVEETRMPMPGRELAENEPDSALMEAVRAGDGAMVRLLLDRGAHADRKNAKGDTPLMLAATKGLDEILALLREKGLHRSKEVRDM